ncbi:MAG: SRPBCC family protein [Jiangellaceae bacterium]
MPDRNTTQLDAGSPFDYDANALLYCRSRALRRLVRPTGGVGDRGRDGRARRRPAAGEHGRGHPAGRREMWFVGEFLEVSEPRRLVYTDAMSDEHDNVVSPGDMGLPPGHPTTTEVRVELEARDATTKMVMTHVGIPADSPGAAGWTMAFDKLTALVVAER